MSRTVITAGSRYLDIDSYSAIVAYAELLDGVPASNAPLNESVVDDQDRVVRGFKSSSDDEFIIVDVSDPSAFEDFVDQNRIVEIIDHHFGFEKYWEEKGVKTQIEKIGAVATIIWERWRDAGRLDEMSKASGKLLMQAILDNTLNFMAGVANERDKIAYADLVNRFGDIRTEYFETVEQGVLKDLVGALEKDMKVIDFKTLGREINVFQLAVWDAEKVLKRKDEVLKIADGGFLNLVSISKGESQIIANDKEILNWANGLMAGQKLFLRKEIVKKDLESIL